MRLGKACKGREGGGAATYVGLQHPGEGEVGGHVVGVGRQGARESCLRLGVLSGLQVCLRR